MQARTLNRHDRHTLSYGLVPARARPRSARVTSAVPGATTVSTSPAAKLVALAIANVAVVPAAANVAVPTLVPFLRISSTVDAVAATAATPREFVRPEGKSTARGKG